MLARLIRSSFTRCFGLLLLLLALVLVAFSPTIGWAQDQRGGTALGVMAPAAIVGGSQAAHPSEPALIESGGMEPDTVQGLDLATTPFQSPLVIPAADFKNNGQAPNGYIFHFTNGYVRSQGGTVYLMAPAYLPDGATVTGLYVSIYDNAGATRPWVTLYRVDNSLGTVVSMAIVATTATSASIQTKSNSTITNPTVSYPSYSYYVGAGLFDALQRIYSVRLYYTGP